MTTLTPVRPRPTGRNKKVTHTDEVHRRRSMTMSWLRFSLVIDLGKQLVVNQRQGRLDA